MPVLFRIITAFNLLCLCLTAALGYAVGGEPRGAWHQLAGVLATIGCCAVHCVVFTYFIATAKWVRHAVAVKSLDARLIDPTRSFKRQAFPAALLAMASVFAAAVAGVATVSYRLSPTLHHIIALLAIAINTAVAFIEHTAIIRNGQLIDKVLSQIPRPEATLLRPSAEATIV